MSLTSKEDGSVHHGQPISKAKAVKATRQDAYRRVSAQVASCQECTNLDLGGSNQYQTMKTCRDCGKVYKEKKPWILVDPESCPHSNVNNAGSSKATHRITCVDCGAVVYEEPQSVFKGRGREAPGFEDKNFKGGSHSKAPMPELPNRTFRISKQFPWHSCSRLLSRRDARSPTPSRRRRCVPCLRMRLTRRSTLIRLTPR